MRLALLVGELGVRVDDLAVAGAAGHILVRVVDRVGLGGRGLYPVAVRVVGEVEPEDLVDARADPAGALGVRARFGVALDERAGVSGVHGDAVNPDGGAVGDRVQWVGSGGVVAHTPNPT